MTQGLYLHIPFCRKACHYCNFHFSTLLKYREPLLMAMLKELESQKDFLSSRHFDTIYFGGGTPSLLNLFELEKLLNKIRKLFVIAPNAEITLEANPDDLSLSYLKGLKENGINRLSIGIQSFDNDVLRWMNRSHNSQQAKQALESAALAGFDNRNADLIYGIPGSRTDYWPKQLSTMLKSQAAHLSAYALTIEPRTVLGQRVKKKIQKEVSDEQIAADYDTLCQWTAQENYIHYEISNFARPGRKALHNSSYWQGKPYLGIGPGAHCFNSGTRQWNIANNKQYINKVSAGDVWFEGETLSKTQQLNEYLMTRLRTASGINPDFIAKHWSPDEKERILSIMIPWKEKKWLIKNETNWRLSEQAWLISDSLISDLFAEESINNKHEKDHQ